MLLALINLQVQVTTSRTPTRKRCCLSSHGSVAAMAPSSQPGSSPSEARLARVATELAMYAVSAVLSWFMLKSVLRQFDPTGNEKAAKQAAAKKRELALRLGRPLLDTNQFEDVRARHAAAQQRRRARRRPRGGGGGLGARRTAASVCPGAHRPARVCGQLIACDVVNPAHINVTFASIGGLDASAPRAEPRRPPPLSLLRRTSHTRLQSSRACTTWSSSPSCGRSCSSAGGC